MNLLLDTHTFIWFINGDESLSDQAIAEIKNIENQCFFSIASIWEIAIKMKLNKLQLKSDFDKITTFALKTKLSYFPLLLSISRNSTHWSFITKTLLTG